MCKDTYVLLCVVTGITVTNIQVTTIRVTPKEGTSSRARSKGAEAHTQQGKMHTGPQDMTARLDRPQGGVKQDADFVPISQCLFFPVLGVTGGVLCL